MSENHEVQAVVTSRGRVTLPKTMRAKLGIGAGSRVCMELRGNELIVRLPMGAYCGMLKGYDLGDIEPEKELDREFD